MFSYSKGDDRDIFFDDRTLKMTSGVGAECLPSVDQLYDTTAQGPISRDSRSIPFGLSLSAPASYFFNSFSTARALGKAWLVKSEMQQAARHLFGALGCGFIKRPVTSVRIDGSTLRATTGVGVGANCKEKGASLTPE